MPTRRSLHLVGLHSSILPLACFMARKDSLKRRNTLKWPNKRACKDSQFLIDRRSACSVPRHHRTARAFLCEPRFLVMPAHSRSKERRRFARLCRGHPRLLGARQTKDVDGRNKSGHDGGYARSALLEPHAGLIAVGEYDAGFFQGVPDVGEGARLQGFAGLKMRGRAGRDERSEIREGQLSPERNPPDSTSFSPAYACYARLVSGRMSVKRRRKLTMWLLVATFSECDLSASKC